MKQKKYYKSMFNYVDNTWIHKCKKIILLLLVYNITFHIYTTTLLCIHNLNIYR